MLARVLFLFAVCALSACHRRLEVGMRVVKVLRGDPAARGCSLDDNGHLECATDDLLGMPSEMKKYEVGRQKGRAFLDQVEDAQKSCPPPARPFRPGDPVGTLGDRSRAISLCDAARTLGALRDLERTVTNDAGL